MRGYFIYEIKSLYLISINLTNLKIMKKNYILSLFFAVCFLQMNAQTLFSQNNLAPVTSIIYTNHQSGNPIVAFDFVVDVNTHFDLSTVTVRMSTANGAALSST